MNTHNTITQLWIELRDAIDRAYASKSNATACLRDYAQNQSWSDDMARLLGRETANERQHRNGRSVRGFSVGDAAKLLLMGNISHGTRCPGMPSATVFLTHRQTAAEAMVIGYLIREQVSQEWITAVDSLDYAKIMQEAG
jgi:hypothetical protein